MKSWPWWLISSAVASATILLVLIAALEVDSIGLVVLVGWGGLLGQWINEERKRSAGRGGEVTTDTRRQASRRQMFTAVIDLLVTVGLGMLFSGVSELNQPSGSHSGAVAAVWIGASALTVIPVALVAAWIMGRARRARSTS